MNSQPLISIVLVAWNSANYLPRCFESLLAQTIQDFEVIVIDNGSKDDGCVGLQEKYFSFILYVERFDTNLGFSRSNNLGAKLAKGKWLTLLNTDAFPEPEWLEHFLEAAHTRPNAFFSSRQIQADTPEFLDGEGDVYHVSGLAWRNSYGARMYPLNEIQEVFSACGAAALSPRE